MPGCLSELERLRTQLLGDRQVARNRLAQSTNDFVRAEHRRALAQTERALGRVKAALAAHLRADDSLQAKSNRLCQLQGIGPTLARALLAELPELGRLRPGQPAALAGLAPFARDSGSKQGVRSTGASGRARVRTALYMGALSAARANPVLAPFYRRLRAGGKPAKVALVAVMRRLLEVCNKLLKNPDFVLAT